MQFSIQKKGFTLIELVVVILCAVLVTVAASSVMLLGLRIHQASVENMERQNEVRIVSALLQKLADEKTAVTRFVPGEETWQLLNDSSEVIKYENHALFANGTVLIDEITGSELNELPNDLLQFIFRFGENEYAFTIHFDGISETTLASSVMFLSARPKSVEDRGREMLVTIAQEQLGSGGQIRFQGKDQSEYYSGWYTRQVNRAMNWDSDTPWCACFLSWLADQSAVKLPAGNIPYFANVNDGMLGFQGLATGNGAAWNGQWRDSSYDPAPGDFIFFELDGDPEPDHVGLVTELTPDGTIWTIEGNLNNQVQAASYTDRSTIVGFGLLNWTAADAI